MLALGIGAGRGRKSDVVERYRQALDEEDCEMGETLSAEAAAPRPRGGRAGDVQDVQDVDDDVKTEEGIAVVLHATVQPAHEGALRNGKGRQGVPGAFEKRGGQGGRAGDDERRLRKQESGRAVPLRRGPPDVDQARRGGAGARGLIQAADGSKASSGSGYIRKCYMGDYRALNVVGSDVAIKYRKTASASW